MLTEILLQQQIGSPPALTTGEIIATTSAIVAAIALFFTGFQFIKSRRKSQLELLESIYKDIRQLEKELGQIPSPRSDNDSEYDKKMEDWSSLFFNTLEWLSFLINSKEIEKKEFVDYFAPAMENWYDSIFLKWASDEQKTDSNAYPELKKFVAQLRSRTH
jgi:hypothetical protein